MPNARIHLTMILALAAAPLAACRGAPNPLPLAVERDLPLAGDTSRFDYESLDSKRNLLFIAHLGASEVLAFDTRNGKVSARIPGLAKVHGVLVVPDLQRVYASATGSDEVVAIDEASFAVVARMKVGKYPDGMAYAPAAQRLYVSDKTGETETVIDVASNRVVATIPLGGEAGNSQFDPVSGHVFVNVQTRAQLVEIDPATDSIVARLPLPGARSNHGLLVVPEKRLALIADEEASRLLVVDLGSGKLAQTLEVGEDPDVLAFDPGLALVYVASESGVVALFRVEDRKLRALGSGFLGPDAHVVTVDPATHLAYFPLREVDGKPVLRVTSPR